MSSKTGRNEFFTPVMGLLQAWPKIKIGCSGLIQELLDAVLKAGSWFLSLIFFLLGTWWVLKRWMRSSKRRLRKSAPSMERWVQDWQTWWINKIEINIYIYISIWFYLFIWACYFDRTIYYFNHSATLFFTVLNTFCLFFFYAIHFLNLPTFWSFFFMLITSSVYLFWLKCTFLVSLFQKW